MRRAALLFWPLKAESVKSELLGLVRAYLEERLDTDRINPDAGKTPLGLILVVRKPVPDSRDNACEVKVLEIAGSLHPDNCNSIGPATPSGQSRLSHF
jgi:hypothetical protein